MPTSRHQSPSANPEGDPFLYLTLSFPGWVDLKFTGVCEISQLVMGAVQMRLGWEVLGAGLVPGFILPLQCPAVTALVLEPYALSRILGLIHFHFGLCVDL